MGVSICEHGGPKIPCLKGILCLEVTNKVIPTDVIMTCYKGIIDFHLIHTLMKQPIQFPLVKMIGNGNIVMVLDFNLPPLIFVQPFGHFLIP